MLDGSLLTKQVYLGAGRYRLDLIRKSTSTLDTSMPHANIWSGHGWIEIAPADPSKSSASDSMSIKCRIEKPALFGHPARYNKVRELGPFLDLGAASSEADLLAKKALGDALSEKYVFHLAWTGCSTSAKKVTDKIGYLGSLYGGILLLPTNN